MIHSFKENWLEEFFLNNRHSKKIPANIADRLFRKLQLLDDAVCEADSRIPPSNHFEKLSGKLTGKHSIRVNAQWRLIFEWDNESGEIHALYLDNHSYK